jgi:uncharacterized membrane protein
MTTVDVETRIVIDRPRDVVARFAGDPSNAPLWYVNIKSVEWKTQPPMKVGSRIAFVAQFLGRRMSYTYQIAEYMPVEKLVMSTTEGPFPMETSYVWEAMGKDRTEMILRNRGTPTGFSKFLAPLIVSAMRRANRKDLVRLKMLMEQS